MGCRQFLALCCAIVAHASTALPSPALPQRRQSAAADPSVLEKHIFDGSEGWSQAPGPWPRLGDDCPAWITDYVAFHKQTRGTPDAKYLINACIDTKHCQHGLGDRLRGLLSSFQLAKAHNRVLLVEWTSPYPLDTFFEPATINWRVSPDLGLALHKAVWLNQSEANLTHANAGTKAQGAQLWNLTTNKVTYRVNTAHDSGVTHFKQVSWEAHCIYKLLLQPTAALTRATDEVQQQLLGSLTQPFVAVHLRLGHLEGEMFDIKRGAGDLWQIVTASYQCAVERDALIHNDTGFSQLTPTKITLDTNTTGGSKRQLSSDTHTPRPTISSPGVFSPRRVQGTVSPRRLQAVTPGPSSPRILMLTDHEDVRHRVASGMLKGVTGPSYMAHHFSHSTELQTDSSESLRSAVTMQIYVDMMLLARARCLVWGKSGFNRFSMTYAWTACTVQVEVCIAQEYGKLKG